jgi:uroporphyrinogen decarboxylase
MRSLLIGDRVPRILYVNGTANLLHLMSTSGADVLSIDWRIPIDEARRRVRDRVVLQGNLDPTLLLGPRERMIRETRSILEKAGPAGHIMNLGHGILPSTPVGSAQAFVETTRNFRHTS